MGVDSEIASDEFPLIRKQYESKGRFYHTFEHIAQMFELLEQCHCTDSIAIEMSIFYHDIVYDVFRDDNEECSAELAADFCRRANLVLIVHSSL
jgi:predicted metal-dependent HD superfamily phosphohydrolase